MSVNIVNNLTGELTKVAGNAQSLKTMTQSAFDAAVEAGTLAEGGIYGTYDSDQENDVVDVIEEDNMHAVTSNAVYTDILSKLSSVEDCTVSYPATNFISTGVTARRIGNNISIGINVDIGESVVEGTIIARITVPNGFSVAGMYDITNRVLLYTVNSTTGVWQLSGNVWYAATNSTGNVIELRTWSITTTGNSRGTFTVPLKIISN